MSDEEKRILADTLDNRFYNKTDEYKKFLILNKNRHLIGSSSLSETNGYEKYGSAKIEFLVTYYKRQISVGRYEEEKINKGLTVLGAKKLLNFVKAYIDSSKAFNNIGGDLSGGAIYFESKSKFKSLEYDEVDYTKNQQIEKMIYGKEMNKLDIKITSTGNKTILKNNTFTNEMANNNKNIYFKIFNNTEGMESLTKNKAIEIFGNYEKRLMIKNLKTQYTTNIKLQMN
ncbi:hypothetical protein OSSY52_13790 [Tepiditoga spiralis]|uniref:Uncharacterized protein n=1 Tax=Tepiditoga spiralis TaxID=2108365 RepID=A0A7G1G435_9BACT|nr:hypothetical protein [Tepiditoga spiralis]BBE31238.1 hypothetical protein OSSY52_13790 [Tepiditoga spiralis]